MEMGTVIWQQDECPRQSDVITGSILRRIISRINGKMWLKLSVNKTGNARNQITKEGAQGGASLYKIVPKFSSMRTLQNIFGFHDFWKGSFWIIFISNTSTCFRMPFPASLTKKLESFCQIMHVTWSIARSSLNIMELKDRKPFLFTLSTTNCFKKWMNWSLVWFHISSRLIFKSKCWIHVWKVHCTGFDLTAFYISRRCWNA